MSELKKCCVDGCNKTAKSKDKYCSMHRARLRRTGSLELMPKLTLRERLETNIQIDENYCWNWMLQINAGGYGRIRYKGKKYLTHRLSYLHYIGRIPKGLLVCHTCDNRKCINPKHLFIGTHKDNHDDAVTKGRIDIVKRAKERWKKCPTLRKQV